MSNHFTTAEAGAPALGPPLIGALLRAPWETVNTRMLEGLHRRGFDDLTAPHLSVMQYPGPENMRPSELAASARMSKQALNYLLRQMEQLGYLTRSAQDADDQRGKRIHLTDRGWSTAKAMREIVAEVESEWEQRLGHDQFTQLKNALTELSSTLKR